MCRPCGVALIAFLATAPVVAQVSTPLTEYGTAFGSPNLSPDGKTLAYSWYDSARASGIFLRPLTGGQPKQFAGPDSKEGLPGQPQWSPDGSQIAFSRFYCAHCDGELFVKPYPGGVERPLGPTCGGPASWIRDGRFLIAGEPKGDERCGIGLVPVDGAGRIQLVSNGDVATVSPNGRRMAYAVGHQLKAVNLTADFRLDGVPVTLASEPHAISSIHWTPDGRGIFYRVWSEAGFYSRLISAQGFRSPPKTVNPHANVEISQLLKDGGVLGVESGGDSFLWRIDLQSPSKEPEKVIGIAGTDSLLAVSPDGQFLAFATNRDGPTQIWTSRLDGREPRALVSAIPPFGTYGDKTVVAGISWSPDAKWIAWITQPGIGHGDDDARLYVVPAVGGRVRALADCSLTGDVPLWSTDSRFVFLVKEDEKYSASYLQVDIDSGKQAPVAKSQLPPEPRSLTSLPAGSQQPHFAQNARYVYFQKWPSAQSRLVIIRDLLPSPANW